MTASQNLCTSSTTQRPSLWKAQQLFSAPQCRVPLHILYTGPLTTSFTGFLRDFSTMTQTCSDTAVGMTNNHHRQHRHHQPSTTTTTITIENTTTSTTTGSRKALSQYAMATAIPLLLSLTTNTPASWTSRIWFRLGT